MSEIYVRVRRLGSYLIFEIPKEMAKRDGIHAGDTIKIRVRKRSAFGALKGIGHMTKEDELDY